MSNPIKLVKVAKVIDQYRVVLNSGLADGLSVGDDFIVFRIGEEIFDPDSNESLGFFEEVIGRGTITHIQENMATLEASELKSSGRKVIKKYNDRQTNLFNHLAGIYGPTEEIIEEPETVTKAFVHAEVGDRAKKL